MSLSSIKLELIYLYQNEEATSTKPSRKRSKSAASTVKEPCKRRVTTAEGIRDMVGTISDMKEDLHTIANPTKSGHAILPDKHTPAIKAIQENEDLSLDDFGDVMMLLTNNHEIGNVYLAIDNSEQRTCYLQKQLECYHKTM